jgi:hypothetical protein
MWSRSLWLKITDNAKLSLLALIALAPAVGLYGSTRTLFDYFMDGEEMAMKIY